MAPKKMQYRHGKPPDTCGQEHPGCAAHSKQTGLPCRKTPVVGFKVCRYHGVKRVDAERKRDELKAEFIEAEIDNKLKNLLASHGVSAVDNPLEEISLLAGEIRTLVTIMRDRVDLEALGLGINGTSPILAVYERMIDRFARLLTDIVRLDIDGRLVKVKEQEAAIMQEVLLGTLDDLNLGDRKPEAQRAYARRLRLVGKTG